MLQVRDLVLAMLVGGSAALQVSLLGSLGRARDPSAAAWISLLATLTGVAVVLGGRAVVGSNAPLPAPFDRAAVLAVLAIAAGGLLALAMRGLPPYVAVTGLLALPFLFGSSFLGPRLGIGLFLGAVVAGQLAGGVLLDHLGAFGGVPRAIDAARLLGVAALVAGVVLIRGGR